MREQELFREYYGPFAKTTFVIIEEHGDSFRLSFDEGPEYNVSILLNDAFTAFKFLPGTIAEIRVTRLYGKKFCFYGAQIPTFARAGREALRAANAPPVPGLDPICMSLDCTDPQPCPDPSKPVLICPGGNHRCAEAAPNTDQ